MAVKLPPHSSLYITSFNPIVCTRRLGISFPFGQTFPQQFIAVVCKSSNNTENEILFVYNVCPTFSACVVSLVTVA